MRTTRFTCDVAGCERTCQPSDNSTPEGWLTGHLTVIGGGWAEPLICPDHVGALRDLHGSDQGWFERVVRSQFAEDEERRRAARARDKR